MARRSLRPHLNQIRTWVQQGRTDAWIAHQLEVTVQQISLFKRDNELAPGEPPADVEGAADTGDDEFDLRAQDDALIAAELEAAEKERAEREAEEAAAAEARAAAGEDDDADADEDDKPARRRGRRGGRGRKKKAQGPYEGTFDHGDEGYGLWLDPAVSDDPVYAEHWAGHRPVEVVVEEDQIIIRRVGDDDAGDDDEE